MHPSYTRAAALFACSMIAMVVPAQTVGPRNPGTTGNNATIGTTAWSTPGSVVSSNDGWATVATKGITQYLTATNFGFTIPSPTGIAGIQMEVERSTNAAINVALLNAWSVGTTKAISAGTNRCLVVVYAQENGNNSRDVTGMTYGGRAMTAVREQICGTTNGFTGRIEAWILLEADIVLAAGTTIVATYGTYTALEYCEAFSSATFSGVDQLTPISSVQGNGAVSPPSTVNPHQLATAITTLAGSMAVNVVTCGSNSSPAVVNGGTNTYTINSGYTEGTDLYFANTGVAPASGASVQTAYKAIAANGTEQPTCTFNGGVNRWAMIGFTLQRARELDQEIKLIKGGAIGGTNLSNTTAWPTTDTYVTYGSSSNLWGRSWTNTDINSSTFGAAVSARVQNGTARVDHVRVTVTYFSTLPVELLGFSAVPEDRAVRLDWATVSENDNDHFTIQRSRDGLLFQDVGGLPGAGYSQAVLHYTMLDEKPWSGTSYYRLVQVDTDGTQTISDAVAVDLHEAELTIYPNPTADGGLTFYDPAAQRLAVAVYDEAMKLVRQAAVNTGEPIHLLGDLPDGAYLLVVRNGDTVHATRVIRQSRER